MSKTLGGDMEKYLQAYIVLQKGYTLHVRLRS